MRKASYKKGDKVVVEDGDGVVTIVKASPCKASVRSPRNDTWQYEVKVKGKAGTFWVDETAIVGLVTFQPITFDAARHFELAESLYAYGVIRKYLETLPAGKMVDGCRVVDALKRLVEQSALLFEGDMEDSPETEIENILR